MSEYDNLTESEQETIINTIRDTEKKVLEAIKKKMSELSKDETLKAQMLKEINENLHL